MAEKQTTGRLIVIVVEARNIAPTSWRGSSSDPYCKVFLDKTKIFKTPCVKKSLEPKWEEIARNIPLTTDNQESVLRFTMWAESVLWDGFLGEVKIPVKDLFDGVPRDQWIALQPKRKKQKVSGDIHVQILWMDPEDQLTADRSEFQHPLQTLMRKKKFEAFKNGVAKGLDLDHCDKDGNPVLHAACLLDLPECVNALLEKGANVKGCDGNGAQPLHMAAAHSANSIPLLLAKGATHDARDKKEQTALHYAAIKNNANSINTLMSKGADVDSEDQLGETPLHRALQEKESAANAIRALVTAGANIYRPNKNGVSCVQLCADETKVNDRTKKDFMMAVGIKDEREFPLRKKFPKFYYAEGKNLSYEWKQNSQFCIKPLGDTQNIQVLMHYLYEDKSAKQMEKTGFIVVTTDEGVHKEPCYQQDLCGYGRYEPFEIAVRQKNAEADPPEPDTFYVVMPYAKTAEIKGYYDLIFYSDGELEIKELIDWKNSTSLNGGWTEELSGGDRSLETWLSNPQYTLKVPKDPENPIVTLTISLAQAKAALDLIPYQVMPYQFYIGYYVLDKELFDIVAQCKTWKNAQEIYSHLFIDTTKEDEFVIIPATHYAGQLTPFSITVYSDVVVELTVRKS